MQEHSTGEPPIPTAAATDDGTFFGRMNDPTGAGVIQGSCGDTMEFYIVVQDETIVDVKFYTEGCSNTRSCGAAAARRALGRKVTDAEMAALNLCRHEFHGDWNYTFSPSLDQRP